MPANILYLPKPGEKPSKHLPYGHYLQLPHIHLVDSVVLGLKPFIDIHGYLAGIGIGPKQQAALIMGKANKTHDSLGYDYSVAKILPYGQTNPKKETGAIESAPKTIQLKKPEETRQTRQGLEFLLANPLSENKNHPANLPENKTMAALYNLYIRYSGLMNNAYNSVNNSKNTVKSYADFIAEFFKKLRIGYEVENKVYDPAEKARKAEISQLDNLVDMAKYHQRKGASKSETFELGRQKAA